MNVQTMIVIYLRKAFNIIRVKNKEQKATQEKSIRCREEKKLLKENNNYICRGRIKRCR